MAPTPQDMGQGQMPDFRVTPLVPPPLGVDSNFDDPVSRSPMAIAVCSIMLFLSVSSMIGRLYARKFILNMVGWDDWVALAGCAFVAEYTIYAIVLFASPGMGPHMWDIPGVVFLDEKYGLKLLFTEVMYCPSAYLVKLSLFLLYRRLFVTGANGMTKYFIYGGIYGSGILYFTLTILSFAFCTESTSLVDGGECHKKGAYVTWALAAVNLATDIYLLAIPPFVISKLHVSTQKKWAISVVFLVSLAATAASIASVYYRVYVSKHNTDFSWTIVPAALATVCELNLGVVCSSLPAMNVIFHRSRHGSRTNTGYKTPSRTGGLSLATISSRFRSRNTPNTTMKSVDVYRSNEDMGDRDIVKLIDISQYSVTFGAKGASLDGGSNLSTSPTRNQSRI